MTDSARPAAVDTEHMRRALALAERGWGQTAPNPMVGAVVVADQRVVGEGFHARYGEAHAEVVALDSAGAAARGATLYVTLEPCAHHGKTPPCVNAIIGAGIARVVAAVRDPSDVARGGVEILRGAGVAVDLGVERQRAIELNAPFFNAHASGRPWVTLKLALSANGKIADPNDRRRWITGPDSRRQVHRLRANSDAIAVGSGTVLADDPALTVRDVPAPRVAPRRIVFDRMLRTPLDSQLVRTAHAVETLVVAAPEAPSDRQARLESAGVHIVAATELSAALELLRALAVRSLLVEGGARLAGAMLREALVDRLVIFRSPITLGDETLGAFDFAPPGFSGSLTAARVIDEERFGSDRMTVYALHEVPCSPD
jgi:diaminohydroxyphosphoribosylaminopyrimidine deaminase / 5-amino-6-(5-phosphoribosylamino)uracil reductase